MKNALPTKGGKSHFMAQRRKDLYFCLAMLAIPFANWLVFWLWPNWQSLVMAFQIPGQEGFTLYNFTRYLSQFADPITAPDRWLEVRNTFLFFFLGIFVNTPFVLVISYIMYKKVYGYKIYRVMFYLPSIIGGTIMTMVFRSFCDVGGPVEHIFTFLGIPFDEWLGLFGRADTALGLLIFYGLWTSIGSNMIVWTATMSRIPTDVVESARLDGVGFFREFFQIVIPMIWPMLTTMIVFAMVGLVGSGGSVLLFCPDTPGTSNIGYYILRHTLNAGLSNNGSLNYPAAVGFLFSALNLPLVFGTKALMDRISRAVEY